MSGTHASTNLSDMEISENGLYNKWKRPLYFRQIITMEGRVIRKNKCKKKT